MGALSNGLLFAAIVGYALAMLVFAGADASRRSRHVPVAARRVLVAAGPGAGPGAGLAETAEPPPAFAPAPRGRAGGAALGLTWLSFLVHLAAVVTRGVAAGRLPWGNMYEFSLTAALVAVATFLVLERRGRIQRSLGAFLLLPVVLYLGLAGTVLYTPVGPLVPALDSYWIRIHVAAAVLATGAFLLSGVVALLYLLRSRFDRRTDRGLAVRFPVTLARRLPAASALDRSVYLVVAFAFPVWTFAVIAGAIWAEAAWGRYWGWDPKETWSFITWVLYAGYLHARATAGWRGRRAAWLAVAAALALIVDYYVVNIFVVGLHSYA